MEMQHSIQLRNLQEEEHRLQVVTLKEVGTHLLVEHHNMAITNKEILECSLRALHRQVIHIQLMEAYFELALRHVHLDLVKVELDVLLLVLRI